MITVIDTLLERDFFVRDDAAREFLDDWNAWEGNDFGAFLADSAYDALFEPSEERY